MSALTRPATLALRSLSLAYFVQATGALSVVGSLAAIAAEWGLSDRQSALLISVFGFSFALATLATALLIRASVPARDDGAAITLATLGRVLSDAVLLPAFLVVFSIAAGVYTTFAFLSPIIRDVFHGDGATVSLAMLVLGVAGLLGNLFVVRAARRYGADSLLVTGLGLLAADLLILLLAPPTLAVLGAVLLLWAFATDMIWPSQQRRIVELSGALRGVALAVTASAVFAGIAAGSALGGLLYERFSYLGNLLASLALLLMAACCLALPAAAPQQTAEAAP